jgi:GNAT superfamily N-acetyltransferase
MSSIPIALHADPHPHVRPLNMLRDLPAVADLIELCFSSTMDSEGQRYIQDMRRAGSDAGFLRWAARMAESTTLPLTGYVWDEGGQIVANISLVPFRHGSLRVYLIANVAVHPDFRRRGIARALTDRAIQHAARRKVLDVWLHVRDDNPGAIRLYHEMGFIERARRTTWQARSEEPLVSPPAGVVVTEQLQQHWPLQQEWLRRLYPDRLAWYRSWSFSVFKPGLANWLYCALMDIRTRQWAALRGNRLEAVLAWGPAGREPHALWLAADAAVAPESVTALLATARRSLSRYSSLSLDYPAGHETQAIEAAGFRPTRTLIWMQSRRATP